ncbi:MAG: hypothetical protein R3A47_08125 [Polyangiales bacterium]
MGTLARTFWGTPLPIWINDVTGEMHAVASVDRLLEKNFERVCPFDAKQKNAIEFERTSQSP